jgi:WD40 repeat protein
MGFTPSTAQLAILTTSVFTIVDVAQGRELWRRPAPENSRLNFNAFSPDGSLLVIVREDDKFELHSVLTGEKVWACSSPKSALSCAFSPDSKLLLILTEHEETEVWDPANDRLVLSQPMATPTRPRVAFYPDGDVFTYPNSCRMQFSQPPQAFRGTTFSLNRQENLYVPVPMMESELQLQQKLSSSSSESNSTDTMLEHCSKPIPKDETICYVQPKDM